MTNKGATVKLTEKQRETIDRLAGTHGQGYVGLTFVRPNTWRSLVGAGLVQESSSVPGMFKLTEQGYAAAGIKPTYDGNIRSAEGSARLEHLRRGNDSAMRTAEAAHLRDSQVLTDSHGTRIGVLGTELVNGRTRLWTVDLAQPTMSPLWVDATPEMMDILFVAEGWARPLFMRRSDSALLFRVLGSDSEGVNLVAVNDERYELHRELSALVEDGWIATDHNGNAQARPAETDVADILHLIDNPPTVRELDQRRTDEALEGVVESDDGHVLIGEVPRGLDTFYWVVPVAGERLTDRHDVLGPYATLDMAEWKRDQYVAAGYPCRALASVTRPTLVAVPAQPAPPFAQGDTVLQLDGTPAEVFEVVGETTVTVRTADGELWEHEADELSPLDPDDPRGRPKTPAELAEDARGLEQQRLEAARNSTDPTVRAFYGVDQPRCSEHDASCADGCTHQHRPAEHRVVTMTLAEYIASVAATVSAVRRAAMLQERAGC